MLSARIKAVRCNTKLPSAAVLERHLKDGLSMNDIAAKYGTVKESVRQRLQSYGLMHLIQPPKPVLTVQPTREMLIADRRAGLGFLSLDVKYGLNKGSAKRLAKSFGLPTDFEAFTIEPDKTIIGRLATAGEHGGTTHLKISLPRIAMHVDALLERSAA